MSRTACAALLFWMIAPSVEARWLKGNTHTHTLRSDGDASPETVVWAEKLEAGEILAALERGDFYASTGPALDTYEVSRDVISITVKPAGQTRYRVQFLSRGKVLQESVGLAATYRIRGDERYVRAKVLDSNGKAAWMQPVVVKR